MRKWYAFETQSWDIIGALEGSLRRSSVLTKLQTGRTRPKTHGDDSVENIFGRDHIQACDEATERLVRSHGVLVHSDSVAQFYRWRDRVYVFPPEVEEPPTVDWDSIRADHLDAVAYQMDVQQAVIEAGFATEPLRHALEELYRVMYKRMLGDGLKGFTEEEWSALRNAKHKLGLSGD